MIEYKVFNDTTKEQIRKLIDIGNRKAKKKNLKEVITTNERNRKLIKKLDSLKQEITNL